MMKRSVLFLIGTWLCLFVHAQTVTWATSPQYESLEEYDNFYKVRERGKVGLADLSGKLILSVRYDSITSFCEHLALALVYDTGKYAVKGIVNQRTGQTVTLSETYYVTEKYPFFSEGKLVVYDSRNRYGYLLPDGSLFGSCRYYEAYPFYKGRACIFKQKGKAAYLQNNGEELLTELEHAGYVLSFASFFNEDGQALVSGKAVSGVVNYVIDTNGKNVRKAKMAGIVPKNYVYRKTFSTVTVSDAPSDNGIKPFREGTSYGFSDREGKVVLPPQFSEAASFRGGYAKVRKEGRYGILRLQSGSFVGRLDKNQLKVRNGKVEPLTYSVVVPPVYRDSHISLLVNEPGKESKVPLDDRREYAFTPEPQHQEETMEFRFTLSADGLLLWKDTQNVTLTYVRYYQPVLSVPRVTGDFKVDSEGYVRADSDNKVGVYAIIENRSPEVLVMTLTMGGNGVVEVTKTVSVAPNSSGQISTVIDAIKERKPVEIFVQTSTGLRQSCVIKVKPFI